MRDFSVYKCPRCGVEHTGISGMVIRKYYDNEMKHYMSEKMCTACMEQYSYDSLIAADVRYKALIERTNK